MATSLTDSVNKQLNLSPTSKTVYWHLLLSPFSWWQCFVLLYDTSARSKKAAFIYWILIIFTLCFLAIWCYMLWLITFDLGYYLTLLSDVSSNLLTVDEGRTRFDDLLWRTIIKTIFISVSYGIIQGSNCVVASIWRQRLCDQFHAFLFKSPYGCSLHETSQTPINDVPTCLTNDIRQFTTHMGLTLFGSLYYGGIINLLTVIILFSIYIVQSTSGDTNGIVISLGAFGICALFVVLFSGKFNAAIAEQTANKGRLRAFLQRLQTNAESIVFYSSQKCELRLLMNLIRLVHLINMRISYWYGILSLPIVLLNSISNLVLYLLPAILFFFLRSPNFQTPDEAKKYLGIIGFYGYIFFNLVSLIWISESCLITVTMGNRLVHMKKHLIKLNELHNNRVIRETTTGMRRTTNHLFELMNLTICLPYKQIILQSNINVRALRNQCVFITGKTGCGKTSLMRICAGLWPLQAGYISIPSRNNLIFIPQCPYLPIGSLRFQVEFLISNKSTIRLSDSNIINLFNLVNMDYILQRYDLDKTIDWSRCLSIGEQQRLSFVRLFALFTYLSTVTTDTLVLLDESTSAIDMHTESIIYQTMLKLNIWFITITHRPSLKSYHSINLQLSNGLLENSEDNNDESNFIENDTEEISSVSPDTSTTNEIKVKQNQCYSWVKSLVAIWRLIHLPFAPQEHKTLRIQTYIAWICCLAFLGAYSYLSYYLASQTGSIFSILSDYTSKKIDIATAKTRLRQGLPSIILQFIGYTIFYSAQIGCGQIIGSLYTQRQLSYISRLLLNNNDSSLYHVSNTLHQLPNTFSHELAEFNQHLFHLLFGSIYFNGILGISILCIPYTYLLAIQPTGALNICIIYVSQLVFTCFILLALFPFYRVNKQWEKSFTAFTNAQKRLDLKAEQIVLSDESVLHIEENYLRSQLDSSISVQQRAGYFYGLLVGISVLGNWAATIIVYCIPGIIYFHLTKNITASQAGVILTMSVFNGYLNNTLTIVNSYGQSISQMWTVGLRVVEIFEELKSIIDIHRHQRANELNTGRRLITQIPNDRVLILRNVDICLPSNISVDNVLIRSLTFSLQTKSTLLISGPSGCGKSSLLRLIARLQYNLPSNFDSCILFLSSESTIFLPQQLHLIEGTLRQQLSYLSESKGLGISVTDDMKIRDVLLIVGLEHLIDRYSLDLSEYSWSRILSIGEQQRLMIASALLVLNTKPINCFVFDEMTAGCDEETERQIYSYLYHLGISYISVSHRDRLINYHTHHLIINQKKQSYTFTSRKNV